MPEVSRLALNAGELSDLTDGRIDLSKFNTGCEILENARVLRVGGATRRAGMEYVGESMFPNSDGGATARKSRVVGFQFSDEQGYAIEFSHLKMRVIQGGVIDATEYVTPWTEDHIFALQFAQRIDRIIVTHPEVPVQNIVKFTDGTWGVSEHPWQERVWVPFPTDDTISMSVNATTGVGTSVTLTSDTAIFLDSTWEGDRIRIDHQVGEDSSEYVLSGALGGVGPIDISNTDATEGDTFYQVVDGLRNFYTCITDYSFSTHYTGSTDLEDYPSFFEQGIELVPETAINGGWAFETFGTWRGTYWVQRSFDDGVSWTTIKVITSNDNKNERVVDEETENVKIRVVVPRFEDTFSFRSQFTVNSFTQSGSAVITARLTDTTATATIEEVFFSTAPSTVWFQSAFSARNGYPAACAFYQSRLALGGTGKLPQTFWLSKTENPFDFTLGTLATDGMSFETDAGGYERITWLTSHLSLLVGTTLGVWAVSSPDGNTLTPESNRINRQMLIGAQPGFQGVPLQNNVLFLENRGRKVQELTGGSVEYGGYLSADLTQLADHITRGGVTQMENSTNPDSALLMVTGGEVAILTYERQQNVVGWARWKTDGAIESVCATSGAGEDDDIYMVVNRNGNRYIEYLTPDMLRTEEDGDIKNLRFLDCYTERVEETSFSTITGLDRFDGMKVQTVVDGKPRDPVTVTSGVATLPVSGTNAYVGLPYTTEIRPTSFNFGIIGSKSSAIEILARFRNTLGGETSQDRKNWSIIAGLQADITDDLVLLSQDYQSTPFSTWGRKPSISIRQTEPLPMTVLAMRIKTKTSR